MFVDLERLDMTVIENCVFLIKRAIESTVSYILDVKWLSGCNEVGGNELYQK